jgi:hypothetical protein
MRPATIALENYLVLENRSQRMDMLRRDRLKGASISWKDAAFCFQLRIHASEMICLLDSLPEKLDLAAELWIFEELFKWPQDVAATALRAWAARSEGLLSHRLASLIALPGLPQRLQYTILDIATQQGGRAIVEAAFKTTGWEDLSPAFIGLLCERGIQFGIKSERLCQVAINVLQGAVKHPLVEEKHLFNLVSWLIASGHIEDVKKALQGSGNSLWSLHLKESIGSMKQSLSRMLLPISEQDGSKESLVPVGMGTDWQNERTEMVAGKRGAFNPILKLNYSQYLSERSIDSFFSAIKNGESRPCKDQGFWSLLAEAWNHPSKVKLESLATEARKLKGLAKCSYILTLGRYVGQDAAVLKIMDSIRSTDEDELRHIVFTLGEINNTRSLLELISMVTRPNVTPQVLTDALSVLSKKDLADLQKEIRATIQDLRLPVDTANPVYELKELLTSKLTMNETATQPTSVTTQGLSFDDQSLDLELSGMVAHYKLLSSEVRRALRTSLFFNHTIKGHEDSHAIDLSPLIDMQYKALELLFRENFEDFVSSLMQRGDIPRKLDVIGYARPIPQKMDDFEYFIAGLPVVKEIPFFSKFKLRKMLRAMCQFEPGKRFTLDGLKAFGLFFLCFGRQQCRFGLANLVDTGLKDDRALAEFARALHIFQDLRNRAAHEGFHPEASNDLKGIWQSTAMIVQQVFTIKEALNIKAEQSLVHHRAS